MPKDYFLKQASCSLSSIAPGARLHFIGVGGVAMGQLAAALADQGYAVSGSDKEFYEPMGSFLRQSAVTLYEGYRAENVPAAADLVVIGNAVSYGHPEVAVVEERQLPFSHFPKLLSETVIAKRRSLVVCGTHGKSTTTTILADLLIKLGADPAYFVGGVVPGWHSSLKIGAGAISVVEGDEYDSAFFAKVPKFSFYRPDICLINSIEFDHADIYPDEAAVLAVFDQLLSSMPSSGRTIGCLDDTNVAERFSSRRADTPGRLISYGRTAAADYKLKERRVGSNGQQVIVGSPARGDFSFTIPLIGEFNARNALAALIALLECGHELDQVLPLMPQLKAPRRRQELRHHSPRLTLIEDFAHHPTAAAESIQAVKEAYPGRSLWAVFEFRSNTSRRAGFFNQYLQAFAGADRMLLREIQARPFDSDVALLDTAELAAALRRQGTPTEVLAAAPDFCAYLKQNLPDQAVLLIMSNGSFDGLVQLLLESFTSRAH